jgi:hypothetical protein
MRLAFLICRLPSFAKKAKLRRDLKKCEIESERSNQHTRNQNDRFKSFHDEIVWMEYFLVRGKLHARSGFISLSASANFPANHRDSG